jgi:lipopolysaccharide biosynthesis glycosyltransferase
MKNLFKAKFSKNKIFLKLLINIFLIIEILFSFFIKTFNKYIMKFNIYFDGNVIKKFNSYDKRAMNFYSTYGYLNFNQLDEIYNGTSIEYSKFNHIHISMSFNNDYFLLSSVTIASILENASNSSFIHIHIIAVDNFIYPTMKKLNSLKYKINNNSEFIFYNGQEAEEAFGLQTIKEVRGIGEYARLLSLKLINSTDRVIVIDSADLIIKNDLFDLYNYPLDDLLFRGCIDPFIHCLDCIFFNKENFINGGVILFNIKKCKEMNIYQYIIKFYKEFKYKSRLCTPYQDILNHFFPAISMGLLPLRFNMQGYGEIKNNNSVLKFENIYLQNCSIFYKKIKEIEEEEKKLVVRHYNHFKAYYGLGSIFKEEWNYYAKKTGFYKEICHNYDKAC